MKSLIRAKKNRRLVEKIQEGLKTMTAQGIQMLLLSF